MEEPSDMTALVPTLGEAHQQEFEAMAREGVVLDVLLGREVLLRRDPRTGSDGARPRKPLLCGKRTIRIDPVIDPGIVGLLRRWVRDKYPDTTQEDVVELANRLRRAGVLATQRANARLARRLASGTCRDYLGF